MRYFSQTTTNASIPLRAKWTWILILGFTGTPTISLDQQQAISVAGFYPPIACPTDGHGQLKPWEQIDTTGTIQLLVGEPGDRIPNGAASAASIAKLYDSNNNPIATLNNNILVGLRGEGNETLAKALASAAPTGALLAGGKDAAGNLQAIGASADALGGGPTNGVPAMGYDRVGLRHRHITVDSVGGVFPATKTDQSLGDTPLTAPGTKTGGFTLTLPNDWTPKRAAFIFDFFGNTGGTLDIYIQTSFDQGGTWIDVIHLPQVAAGAAEAKAAAVLDAGNPGTAPLAGLNVASATPTLAVNTTRNLLGSRWRIVLVSGAGTSASAPVSVSSAFC